MSSRTVSVVLTAQVQNYLTNMRAAEQETRRLADTTKTVSQRFAMHNQALRDVGVGMVAVGATAAAGLAIAVKAASDFGAKMAQLQSLSHANEATMKQAAAAAMSVGTAYGFTATQVADAQIELQKAGIGVEQQLGGALKGALSLAAAGQLDVAQATEITTVAMTQFGLSAKDVPHLADLLSAGADKALGSVGDLGEALKNGGLQAHNMGLSLDDTVGLLSSFANVGILGAEAGTQLRSMFLRLQNPTKEAQDVLDKYGISINDASGKFVGITKFAGELRDRLHDLDPATRNAALAQVFGSHAIVGATALYQSGAQGIAGWIDRVNEGGFASAQAAGKLNSLQGDVQKLSAAFQTDLIKAGTGANDALRNVAQGATRLLGVVGDMPAPLLDVGFGVGTVVAGVGLLGGAALIAVPKVVALRGALTELGISGRTAGKTFAKGAALTAGLIVLTEGLAGLGQQGMATSQQIELTGTVARNSFKDLDKLFSSTTFGGAQAGFKNALDFEGLGSSVQKFGSLNGTIGALSETVLKNEGTFDALGQQLAGMAQRSLPSAQQGFRQIVQQYDLTADQQKKLLALMPALREELIKQAGAAHVAATDTNLLQIVQGKGAASTKVLASSQQTAAAAAARQEATLASLAGQASTATTNIDDLQKSIEGFGSAQLDARGATRAMYQAIADATKAVRTNGAGLDVTTQKGRDNQAALDGIATAATNAASKILKQTGSTRDAAKAMQIGRDAYIRTAEAMGLSRDAAVKLADKIELIPTNIPIAVDASGFPEAGKKILDLTELINGVPRYLRTTVSIDAIASASLNGTGPLLSKAGKAAGGEITGPGAKGVDSVPALLAPGEHVLTTADVDRLGGQGGVYAFRSALQAGTITGYAKGGAVAKKAPDPNQINVQKAAADAAKKQAATSQAAIDAATKRLKAQQKAAAAATKAVEKARDAAAKISGKGSAAAKHKATLQARDLAKKAKTADARVKATQKTIDAQTKTRDDAKQRQQDALDAAQALRQGREDFVSTQRRATAANPIDPLSYVDQARQLSRDDNLSQSSRDSLDAAANQYERSLVQLQTKSTAAAEALSNLRDSSKQMRDSITQSISGGYTLAGARDAAGSATSTGNWIERDGIRYQTGITGGALTAASISSYFNAGASSSDQFASALQQLADRGVNGTLLAQLAQMGTADGMPIAQAILSGSSADIAGINQGFGSLQVQSDRAGGIVADYNYAAQIAAADRNAQQITDEITAQGNALRKLIAGAFGLSGYAVGTRNATRGLHWVGEDGPELAGFTGGETVLNAVDSRRWVRGAGGGSAAPQVTVQTAAPQMPDTITVRDLQGFEVRMQVIADRRILADAQQDAVLMMGGAA